MYSSDYQIVAVSETWLSDYICDKEILPTGYSIYRKDRQSRGGGVLLAVDQRIRSIILPTPSNLEVLTIKIFCPRSIILSIVYRPPNSADTNQLLAYLAELLINDRVLILGDFNYPDINWQAMSAVYPASDTFCDFVYDNGLTQLIQDPTHCQGNILDLLLTNSPSSVAGISVSNSNFTIASDHFPIYFTIEESVRISTNASPKEVYNYSKTDFQGLTDYLLAFDFSSCLSSTDIDELWLTLKSIITNATHRFTPLVKLRQHHNPKWFTAEIRHKLHRIHSKRKKNKAHPTKNNLNELHQEEHLLNEAICEAKQSYENRLVQDFPSNSTKLFRYIRSFQREERYPPTMHLDSSSATTNSGKATLFNQFFHSVFTSSCFTLPSLSDIDTPSAVIEDITITDEEVYQALIRLDPSKASGADGISPRILKSCALPLCSPIHHLFSLCLTKHLWPSEWKLHRITPLYKSKDRTSVSNYRPISLLCIISKVLERLIYDKIKRFCFEQD